MVDRADFAPGGSSWQTLYASVGLTSEARHVDFEKATGVRGPVFTGRLRSWFESVVHRGTGEAGNPLNLKRVMPPQGVRLGEAFPGRRYPSPPGSLT